jgi:SAM-dependent methyltransferase
MSLPAEARLALCVAGDSSRDQPTFIKYQKEIDSMKETWDVHGHTMWDAWKGLDSFDIVERDDGYIDSIDGASYLAQYRDWPEIERRAMKLVKGRVIDLGCGAGRVSLYLQGRGFDVVGLDISPLALKTCRERGLRKTKLGSVLSLKLREASFDTAILFGNNFGLLGTPSRAKRVLLGMSKIVTSGGLILAETADPYQTDEPVHLAYHRQNMKRGRLAGQIRMRVRYKQYCTPWFDWLLASRSEMKDIVQGTGFRMTGSVDSEGPRYVGILRKD